MLVGGYPVTACRTACLYGVTYSRTSPTYHDGVTSLVSGKTAPPRGANAWGLRLSPHGALRAYTVFLTAEPRRGSPMA